MFSFLYSPTLTNINTFWLTLLLLLIVFIITRTNLEPVPLRTEAHVTGDYRSKLYIPKPHLSTGTDTVTLITSFHGRYFTSMLSSPSSEFYDSQFQLILLYREKMVVFGSNIRKIWCSMVNLMFRGSEQNWTEKIININDTDIKGKKYIILTNNLECVWG